MSIPKMNIYMLLLISLSLSIVAKSQFPSSPIFWSTPDYLTTTSDETGASIVSWKMIDMNGDNSPDLVYPYRWGGLGSPGNYYWEVYLNNGSGFDPSPFNWSTPDWLTTTSDETGSSIVSWNIIDMNGDNSPDLVYPYRWAGMGSPGNYYWEVYLGQQIITSQESLSKSNQIKVYPNPTSKELYINSSLPVTNIQILDVYGKEIVLYDSDSNHLDVSELPSGIYFLKLTSEGSNFIKKFIKK